MELSEIITAIGILVATTNVIVEVVKKVTWDKIPTSLLATIISIVMTVISGTAYLQVKKVETVWYMWVAMVVVGFLVAYAAMYGFDKLREVMNWRGGK